ncbi:hypothetical protein HYH03_002067 [Edaphochlamys debaryana]|uniref:Uncharacterized protein n=1 Tax=Edaphochlamys debaryana TaxID=47281 RepID=A0A835YB88_9CHLO|nr:hypothetical protein HYH03_002067 [Edaphochlamys debaryana]|eukprot:KAG2499770.1 hypothetical protein HYH03_002067 [Edaphochlamys debaryana]
MATHQPRHAEVSPSTGAGGAGPGPASASATGGVFVDAVTGRHASTSAAELLARRQLTWTKHYGWQYDAWVDDPARYALAGANGRFSLPALARGLTATLSQAASSAALRLQQHQAQLLQPLQPLLQPLAQPPQRGQQGPAGGQRGPQPAGPERQAVIPGR